MTENFERHRSTRWVKADVPSYGDEWGTEYDDYENENEHEHDDENEGDEESKENHKNSHPDKIPVKNSPAFAPMKSVGSRHVGAAGASEGYPMETPAHPMSSSTLVLSVDKSNFTSRTEDSSEDESTDGAEEGFVRPSNATSGPQEREPQVNRLEGKLSVQTAEVSNKSAAALARDFLPPTPTYQSSHKFLPESPETDATDRSYLSDTDSIQREPDSLNVRTFPIQSSVPFPALADNDDVHSKIHPSTRSRASEELSSASMSTGEQLFLEPAKSSVSQAAPETLVLSIDRMNLADSDDSSFDDLDSPSKPQESQHDATYQASLPQKKEKENVENDDDDDDDDWGYNSEHSSNFDEQDKSLILPEHQPHKVQNTEVQRHRVKTDALDSLIDDLSKMEGDTSLFDETRSFDQSATKNLLPTLESIQNFQLPDFENHSFNDGNVSKDYIPSLSSAAQNEGVVSRARKGSVRKPPPFKAQQEAEEPKQAVSPGIADSLRHDIEEEKTDVVSEISKISGSPEIPEIPEDGATIQKDTVSQSEDIDATLPASQSEDIAASLPMSKGLDVNRRASTISTSTFNLGNWKPKTNMYRDQFVNDNDNESQMNVSLYNKDDATYKKFTRMGSVLNYTPSVCISVPDSVETNLGQINEDQSDGEYPDIMSVAKSYHPVTSHDSSDHSLGSSILHDHTYEKPKFLEHSSTPAVSADDLQPITEEAETKDGYKSQLSAIKKYPVSNWKKIMSTSQPVDRIDLLKKARIDEANYETGLSQWLRESLKSTESPHIQIGELATQAYKNAQHSDIRRHTSIRSKVNLVRDKMETGNLGIQASSLGRKFFSRGKKLMKQSSD